MTTPQTSPQIAAAAIAAAADAVVTVDTAGKITSWNNAAEAVFGYPSDRAIGETLALIIPAQHRPRHVAGFHAALSNGSLANGGRPGHVEATTADGTILQLHMTLGLIKSGGAAISGVVAILRPDGNDVSFI
jgi:PAS domain S-box-containing protein